MIFLQRPSYSSGLALPFLAALLLAFLPGQRAHATTTFTVTTSHNLIWTTNDYKPVIVRRNGKDSLRVSESLSGSSNFTITTTPNYLWWPDSAHDSAWSSDSLKYFYLYFSSGFADTSHGVVVLSSGTQSDTIYLTGYGTASSDSLDFGTSGSTLLNREEDSITGPHSVASIVNWIDNHQNMYIHVVMTLSDSTYWKIRGAGSVYETLYPNESAPGDAFQIDWTPHGVAHDSVTLHLVCTSPHYQTKDIVYYAMDTTTGHARPYDAPTITAPELGTVDPGDTVCGTVTIKNNNPRDISITSISLPASHDWYSSGVPSTPLTLVPGDSVTLTVCYAPGSTEWGAYGSYSTIAYFTDSSGHHSSAYDNASAFVTRCSSRLQDSIFLDDVMTGGSVEGQARFIVHGATTYDGLYSSVYDHSTYRLDSLASSTILSPSVPLTASAGDTVVIRFRVTPDRDGNFLGSVGLLDTTAEGCVLSAEWFLRSLSTSSDSLQLFPDQTDLLTLHSTTSTTSRTFYFYNNAGTREFVTGVSLSAGAHFHITGYDPHSPWDTLATGGRLGVTIQFDADSTGFYKDTLSIETKNGLKGQSFVLEGVRGTQAGVQPTATPSPVMLSIVPNPASGPVTITLTNARRSTLEIFDMLGARLVTTSLETPTYAWEPRELPKGSYIVRTSGTDNNGAPFVVSKRLALTR